MERNHFTLLQGEKPVLISAPHVYHHKRPSLRGVLKQGEQYLDQTVTEVCRNAQSYGIFLNEACPEYDPNYHKIPNNPYKQEIKQLIDEKKVGTVIDLHGLSNYHSYDIAVYHCIRFQKSKKLALEFLDLIAKEKEFFGVNFHIGYMAQNLQETITEFVCEKLRKPAFQVEISWEIRKSPVLRDKFDKVLSDFVTKL